MLTGGYGHGVAVIGVTGFLAVIIAESAFKAVLATISCVNFKYSSPSDSPYH